MSRYVEDGFFDCGLTGRDWVEENCSDVEIVSDLVYSRASNRISKWVLAVPEHSEIREVRDLEGKSIATELVGVTQKYLAKHNVNAEIEFSWGATEVKVPELVDAIVDLTETGSSLRANNLRIVDVLMETNTVLIANKESWANEPKRSKIENISLMLEAALHADTKVGLKLNIEKSKIIELDRFIFSVGIRHIGQENAKILAGYFKSIKKFSIFFNESDKKKDFEYLVNLDGIGGTQIDSIEIGRLS